jgi:uncharacterized protein (TIGR03435 family)
MIQNGGNQLVRGAVCLVWMVAASAVAATSQSAQRGTPSARPVAFEVASIRPHRAGDLLMSFWFTPDGVSIANFPLHSVLQSAFLGMHEYGEDRFIGEPGWVKSERYDIHAKVGEKDVARWKKLPVDEQRQALGALLAERFQLRFHHETRIRPVYLLSRGKGALRLKEAQLTKTAGGEPYPHMFLPDEPGHLESHATFMWQLVDELERHLDCLVVDKTGLTETYDYNLQWTPDLQAPPEVSGPSLFTALKELGLKLELEKNPVDVVVIDRIEHPSPN